jgi:hypothetical protein
MPSIRNRKKAAKARVGDACPTAQPKPKPTLKELCELDPLEKAMSSGSSWGDLEEPAVSTSPTLEEMVERMAAEMHEQEQSIWNQPWSDRLGTYYADAYDLRDLTEEAYAACMSWLYEKGWNIKQEDRDGVKAYPDNLPPRVWIPVHVHECKRKKVPVPRFCRAGVTCVDAECRYVHEDTIRRLNEPCNFGASCGASDPAKRALCIRMHPGETWTPELVVHRPKAEPQAQPEEPVQ